MMTQLDVQGAELGTLRLTRGRDALLAHGVAMPLKGNSLALLARLVEARGRPVPDQELVNVTWPGGQGTVAALRQEIAAANALLGQYTQGGKYIVRLSEGAHSLIDIRTPGRRERGLASTGAAAQRVYGREGVLLELASCMGHDRLVTLVGCGGIGKTTVARALVGSQGQRFRDGSCFVGLGAIARGIDVANAIASVLCVAGVANSGRSWLADLQNRNLLLILDNCEHVLEDVAAVAASITASAAQVQIVATSHQSLGIVGERVVHLGAIAVPGDAVALTPDTLASCPSVQLFCASAQGHGGTLHLDAGNADAIAQLCRRLGGHPLAICMAASRAIEMGPRRLAEVLDSSRMAYPDGQACEPQRHQSLESLHMWSYQLLTRDQAAVLRRLSVFQGQFTLADAESVVWGGSVAAADVALHLGGLVAKSLVVALPCDEGLQYVLLDTTRSFASARLRARERQQAHERHAQRVLDVLTAGGHALAGATRSEWLSEFGRYADEVRGVLDRSPATGAAAQTQVQVILAAVPLYYQLSLLEEGRRRVEQALALGRKAPLGLPVDLQVQLRTILGGLIGQTRGLVDGMSHAYDQALALSRDAAGAEAREEATGGKWMELFMAGDYGAAVSMAQQLVRSTSTLDDGRRLWRARRMLVQSCHFDGQLHVADAIGQEMIEAPEPARSPLDSSVSARVSMRVIMARSLWLRGQAPQARALAQEAVELASDDVSSALAQALAWAACPIALWSGDDAYARSLVDRLLQHTASHGLHFWRTWAAGLDAVATRRGWPSRCPAGAQDSEGTGQPQTDLFATLGTVPISEALVERALSGAAGWCAAELLRLRGEELARDPGRQDDALAVLQRAGELARRQGAGAWELRAALSEARIHLASGRASEARRLVASMRGQFPGDACTVDLRTADAMISTTLSSPLPPVSHG